MASAVQASVTTGGHDVGMSDLAEQIATIEPDIRPDAAGTRHYWIYDSAAIVLPGGALGQFTAAGRSRREVEAVFRRIGLIA